MAKLKCASFFAGVGGIDMGFEQTKFFKTVYANEFDQYPVRTYEENFKIKVDCRDINFVAASEIPDFDVMLAGFPCQAFSVAGYRKGFDDEKGRGTLFFEMANRRFNTASFLDEISFYIQKLTYSTESGFYEFV